MEGQGIGRWKGELLRGPPSRPLPSSKSAAGSLSFKAWGRRQGELLRGPAQGECSGAFGSPCDAHVLAPDRSGPGCVSTHCMIPPSRLWPPAPPECFERPPQAASWSQCRDGRCTASVQTDKSTASTPRTSSPLIVHAIVLRLIALPSGRCRRHVASPAFSTPRKASPFRIARDNARPASSHLAPLLCCRT